MTRVRLRPAAPGLPSAWCLERPPLGPGEPAGRPLAAVSLPAALPAGLPGLRRAPTPRTACPLGRGLMSWLWQPSLAQGQAGQAASGAWVEPGRSLTLSAVLLLFVFRGLIFFFSFLNQGCPSLASSCRIIRVTRPSPLPHSHSQGQVRDLSACM